MVVKKTGYVTHSHQGISINCLKKDLMRHPI